MLKVEFVEVWGFGHAIRGMRNPMNSWDKCDSVRSIHAKGGCVVGKNDLDLMKRLCKGGTEHRKFLRQIFVSMDITAPLYWWKEFDTYKIGTVANSCSTMHKIHVKELRMDDFSHEHLGEHEANLLETVVQFLNLNRGEYLRDKKKNDWWQMIQLLPSSYNQRRTVTMTYENALVMILQRENHKLDEWREVFVPELKNLPYMTDLLEAVKGE